MNEKVVIESSKGIIAMICGIFGFMYHAITPLFFILVLLMVTDYATGLAKASIIGNIASRRGFKGIIKKVCYIVLVAICILADYAVAYLGSSAGIELGFTGIFTILVSCWLIGVELISIIENLGEIGVPIPGFLKKAFEKFKETAEQIGDGMSE